MNEDIIARMKDTVLKMRAEGGKPQFFGEYYDTEEEADAEQDKLGSHIWKEDSGNGAWSMHTATHFLDEKNLYQLSVTIWPYDAKEALDYVPEVVESSNV